MTHPNKDTLIPKEEPNFFIEKIKSLSININHCISKRDSELLDFKSKYINPKVL